MSEKDNSDFSPKTPKVWSRELRNRFVISSEKRSIRFTNDGKLLLNCLITYKITLEEQLYTNFSRSFYYLVCLQSFV